MPHRKLSCVLLFSLLLAPLGLAVPRALAFDESKYPDWSGQWRVLGGNRWDPTKPGGLGQNPPLTSDYQKVFEASVADQNAGGQGNDFRYRCMPAGMPRVMTAIFPFEFVILPKVTYILFESAMPRRIYTDGRDFEHWPKPGGEPAFGGFSIGKWIDEDGDGRYDLLEVETRGPFKGPRAMDQSGLPVHNDNSTIVKERLYRDKTNKDLFHDDITTIDNAFTKPWVVKKSFRREADDREWYDNVCEEGNNYVGIGKEVYFLSGDGLLMPAKKDQAPPDLRYFNRNATPR
jgi:hypothetical protein